MSDIDLQFRQHRECKVIPITPARDAWVAWASDSAGEIRTGINGPFPCVGCAVQYEAVSYSRRTVVVEKRLGGSTFPEYDPDYDEVGPECEDMLESSDVQFLLLTPASWDLCWHARSDVGWTREEAEEILAEKVALLQRIAASKKARAAAAPAPEAEVKP